MSILKDFIKMVFGLADDHVIKNYEVIIFYFVFGFILVVLSMALK